MLSGDLTKVDKSPEYNALKSRANVWPIAYINALDAICSGAAMSDVVYSKCISILFSNHPIKEQGA